MSEETRVFIETTSAKALCFTSDRVIVAKYRGITPRAQIAVLGGVVEVVLGSLLAVLSWRRSRQLRKLSPESLLTADRENFAIPYALMNKVEVLVPYGPIGTPKWERVAVRITAGGAKHEFRLRKPKEYASYVSILRPVLADKLIVSY